MMKRDLIIAILATFCLTATLFLIMPTRGTETTTSTPNSYDPWADFYGKGKIDMLDIGYVASLFGTKGDPTRNVTVTNWPTGQYVNAWWNQWTGGGGMIYTSWYNASGYGHLHVLAVATSLVEPQQCSVTFWSELYNQTRTGGYGIGFDTFVLTQTSPSIAVSIDVPSEVFYFSAQTISPTNCHIPKLLLDMVIAQSPPHFSFLFSCNL
jgi:hypothetical protein